MRRRRSVQALDQEQQAFEQRRSEHMSTFRLQRAMGWTIFLLVPLDVVMAVVEPISLAGLGPGSVMAFWYWRRVLSREPPDLAPTTRDPGLGKS
jgi:hypothetical protein